MNDTRVRHTQHHCHGAGVRWGAVFWIVLGVLALAALSVLPSLLTTALSESGLL
jgi:hypothetical protein